MKYGFIAFLVLAVVGCGEDSGSDSGEGCSDGEYYSYIYSKCMKYDTMTQGAPHQGKAEKEPPAPQKNQPQPENRPMVYSNNTPSKGATETNSGTQAEGSDDSADKTANKLFKISDEDCRVNYLKLFDSGFGLTAIYTADCLEGVQLFYRTLAYDGSIISKQTLISSECYDYFDDVDTIGFAASSEKILGYYACGSTSKKLVKMNLLGDGIEKQTSSTMDHLIFNEAVGKFGAIIGSQFKTFTASGSLTTESYTIPSSHVVDRVQALGAGWALATSSYSSSYCYYCSGVSRYYLLSLDSKSVLIKGPVETGVQDVNIVHTGRIVSVKNYGINIASLNSATLSISPFKLLPIGTYSSTVKLHKHFVISGLGIGLLHEISGSLSYSVVTDSLTPTVLKSYEIASQLTNVKPAIVFVGDFIYVGYVGSDGNTYVSYISR